MVTSQNRKNTKTILSYLLIALMACAVAGVVPTLINYQGMGTIFKRVAPVVLVVALFVIFEFGASLPLDQLRFSTKKAFRWNYLFLAVFVSICWVLVSRFITSGLVPAIATIISILGILVSLSLLIFGSRLNSFIVLILTVPFIRFVELQLEFKKLAGFLFGPLIVTPIIMTLLLFFAVYFLRRISTCEDRHIRITPYTMLYLLFVLFCTISTLNSPHVGDSAIGLVVEVVLFPVFFFLARDLLEKEGAALRIFYAIVGFIALRLILSLYLMIRGDGGASFLAVSQVEVLTTVATLAVPFSVGALIVSRKLFVKTGAVFLGVMALAAIVIGDKREPIVALSLTLPFLFLLRIGYKKALLLSSISGFIVVIVLLSIFYGTHLHSIPTTLEGAMSDKVRLSAWWASLRIIGEYPFLGIGFGNFARLLDYYAPQTFSFLSVWPLVTPHNYMLHYLTSVGAIASSMLFLMIGYTYVMGVRMIRRSSDPVTTNLVVVILWAMTCFLIAGNTGGTMVPFAYSREYLEKRIVNFVPDFGILLWIFIGYIRSIYCQSRLKFSSD